MRVALLYMHALDTGGYPRDIRALASALAARGARVTLVSAEGTARGGLVDRVVCEGPEAMARVAREADVVHVLGILLPAQMLMVRRLRRRGAPVVVSPLGQLMPHGYAVRRWKKAPYLRLIAPWLAGAWFHTFGPAESAALDLHFPGARRFEAPLGVYPCPQGADRDARGTGSRTATFIYLGRNDTRQKGIDLLLEALAIAAHEGVDCSLTIAGSPWRDSARSIEAQIRRLGLDARVQRVGEFEEARKWSLLAQADYLVFPSRWDGPPRPVREALSVGLPVVVTPETNLGHLVASHGAGLQVALGPDAIAEGLRHLCGHPQQRPSLARGALALAARLQWNRVADDYLDGYRRMLGAWPSLTHDASKRARVT